jgi:hypothetical protein
MSCGTERSINDPVDRSSSICIRPISKFDVAALDIPDSKDLSVA